MLGCINFLLTIIFLFKNLKKCVEEEQSKFQNRLEMLANKIHKAQYDFIHPDAKRYMEVGVYCYYFYCLENGSNKDSQGPV